jgi:hypothetical protein
VVRRSLKLGGLAWCLAWLAFAVGGVRAEAAPVAVVAEGHEAPKLRDAVAAAVPAGWSVVAKATVAHAWSKLHGKTLAARLDQLAEHTHAEAALHAHADAHGKVTLWRVRAGAQPEERRVQRTALGPAVAELLAAPPVAASSSPPPAPPPPPPSRKTKPAVVVAPPAPVAAPAPESVAVVARPEPPAPGPLLQIALTGGVGARRLQYTDPITMNLPTYSAAAVPWMGFRAALFPLARTGVRFLRDLGVYGDFGQSLYQQSAVAGGGPILSATWSSFDAGLRWRMQFAERRHITPSVGVAFAYGRTAFTFDDGGQLLGGTPSVDYRYLRPALDARVAFGPVIVRADAGYRAVLSAGYVGSHFPRADIGGVDVSVGLAVELPKRFELGITGQYQRFFYDMHVKPGDPFIAGGALDEFVVGELALAYVF